MHPQEGRMPLLDLLVKAHRMEQAAIYLCELVCDQSTGFKCGPRHAYSSCRLHLALPHCEAYLKSSMLWTPAELTPYT